MKKLVLSAMFVTVVLNLFATIRTVCNNPATIAQFSTIQGAIDASSSGDTVYVHSSPVSYSGFSIINKQIVVIGAGMLPDVLQNATGLNINPTINSGITISGVASSNTEIHGLYINSGPVININNPTPSGIKFYRNLFANGNINLNGTISNLIIENNYFFNSRIIGSGASGAYSNFVIQNNLFQTETGASQVAGFIDPVNVLINHNLWVVYNSGGVANSYMEVITNSNGLLITNNIFVRRFTQSTANGGVSNSSFLNNITFYPLPGPAAPAAMWTINGNTDGGGNIHNTDPQMAAQTTVNSGLASYRTDYTIPAGPANNTGSDGKDMGLLFNIPPDPRPDLHWINGLTSRLPFVYSMNITNPVIGAGGTLNISVEARKNN